jgi:hypothetical protein
VADPTWKIANMFMVCLQEQFPHAGLPTPGNFCMIAGEAISEDIDPIVGTDLCCEGMGWVRIGDRYPSSNFPAPDPVLKGCLPVAWAQPMDIGLLGCYQPGGEPHMASCEEKTEQAVFDLERLNVLNQVACCFQDKLKDDPNMRGKLWTVTGLTVSGPRGNCISRIMSVVVQIGKCCP